MGGDELRDDRPPGDAEAVRGGLSASYSPRTKSPARQGIGDNLFDPDPVAVRSGVREWFDPTPVEQTAAFCQRSADESNRRSAEAQDQLGAGCFAEERRANGLRWLYCEVHPNANALVLVRNFNALHGRRIFGVDRLKRDAEFARFVRRGLVCLLTKYSPKCLDRAHLIRDEGLVERPTKTLRSMLAYLELDLDDATFDGTPELAMGENPEMRRHRTSGALSSSISLWREALDSGLQAICTGVLGNALRQFGYAG